MYSVVRCRLSNFSAIIYPTSDRPGNAATVRILSREDLSARLPQLRTTWRLFPPLCQIMSTIFSALTLLVGKTSYAS
ncbi:hypothetical protein BD309DRAFT_948656 [Dichomitus squalens]|uniref:Uncharacterized protein n=1 Tax=Dichomitus squalens TaxID=114155 RepID=A0A4Q9PKR8_9APHY|nr:hypothetical protein BD309DRAFT_948656 [Dichomitus squalens]TBU54722.1 hypothetical protein BD310DRAFT_935166 [Dichomitus squalens]TBU58013.1 hypothetical protein BD310DRAFT_928115 [Dichomitus squalens]